MIFFFLKDIRVNTAWTNQWNTIADIRLNNTYSICILILMKYQWNEGGCNKFLKNHHTLAMLSWTAEQKDSLLYAWKMFIWKKDQMNCWAKQFHFYVCESFINKLGFNELPSRRTPNYMPGRGSFEKKDQMNCWAKQFHFYVCESFINKLGFNELPSRRTPCYMPGRGSFEKMFKWTAEQNNFIFMPGRGSLLN